MDTITDKIISAWRREGLPYVVKNAPNYLKSQYLNYLLEHLALDREDLVSRCKEQDQIWYYDSGTQFEMSPPLNEEVPTEHEDLIGTRSVGSNFVCEVSNARLVGPYAIPVTPAKRIIKETFGTDGMFHSRLRRTFEELGKTKSLRLLLNLPALDRNHTQYDTVAHLVVRHGPNYDNPNYGHWIMENLPQIQAIEYYTEVTGDRPKLLINPSPPGWLTSLLRFLGYDSDDWIEWTETTATCENLIIPKLSYAHSFNVDANPKGQKWARETVLNRLSEYNSVSNFEKRVFLSRQGGRRRKILNIDEVKEVLHRYNFAVYRPEDLNMLEEINLTSQAEVVVGVTGSNIAGIGFSPSASLVEILPYKKYLHGFYTLCNELNLQYVFVSGEKYDEVSEDQDIHDDIKIDVNKLETAIKMTQ